MKLLKNLVYGLPRPSNHPGQLGLRQRNREADTVIGRLAKASCRCEDTARDASGQIFEVRMRKELTQRTHMSRRETKESVFKWTMLGAQLCKGSFSKHFQFNVFRGFRRMRKRPAVDERTGPEAVPRLKQKIEQFATICSRDGQPDGAAYKPKHRVSNVALAVDEFALLTANPPRRCVKRMTRIFR